MQDKTGNEALAAETRPATRTWFSPDEIAADVGVEHRTVRRAIASGELPARRVGRTKLLRVHRDDIDRWLRPEPAPGQ